MSKKFNLLRISAEVRVIKLKRHSAVLRRTNNV